MVTIRNGDGPTVLLMSGNHGDEYEGQIALTKLCSELEPTDIRGRLLILTMANYPAAEAGLRTSPIDDGNLNRSFPGDPLGTPTQAIAHYIEEVLMPMCDYCLDLHSGGSSLVYAPTLLRGRGVTAAEAQTLVELQQAFDAPYAWVFKSGGRQTTNRTSMAAASRKGVISLMAELGGGGAVTPWVLALTERGVKRVLHFLGMLPNYQADAANGTRELRVQGSVYAYDFGVFEPFKELGDEVESGDATGAIHHPEEPWREATIVRSQLDGMVLCKRAPGRVARGDCVFQIATDLE
ncbi:MAG: succinylglutamate desuccinylase/aspartoacylase family protein [Kiloniellales bacterium]|nr:succinylglutamate desuccinylase/aspartoacylase family protein [Kiloniellales bacterium]